MEPSSTDLAFLKDANKAVFDAMAVRRFPPECYRECRLGMQADALTLQSVDPEGVYLMQGWLFHEGFWHQVERIEAYLSGVPNDQMMILDLNSGVRACSLHG